MTAVSIIGAIAALVGIGKALQEIIIRIKRRASFELIRYSSLGEPISVGLRNVGPVVAYDFTAETSWVRPAKPPERLEVSGGRLAPGETIRLPVPLSIEHEDRRSRTYLELVEDYRGIDVEVIYARSPQRKRSRRSSIRYGLTFLGIEKSIPESEHEDSS
jgi:hypothetical protein